MLFFAHTRKEESREGVCVVLCVVLDNLFLPDKVTGGVEIKTPIFDSLYYGKIFEYQTNF